MAPWSISAKLESTREKVAAAAVEPYCSMLISADTKKIPAVFILANQATMIPVQPTSSVIAVDRIPAVPTLKAAASPMRQADKNTVRSTIFPTFIPAYRAVPALSPTTAIS